MPPDHAEGELFTIGFTKRTAAQFFGALQSADIGLLVDIRLNNTSQLAGFTKRDDLAYFLDRICAMPYRHEPVFAPTPELLAAIRGGELPWDEFAEVFRGVLHERSAADHLERATLSERPVLLCAEYQASECHRSIVADYLSEQWGGCNVVHL